MPPDPSRAPCGEALAAFADRAFGRWAGLPPACTLAEVVARFEPVDEGVGRGALGDPGEEAHFAVVRVPSYELPVRVWYRGGTAVLLDAEYPDVAPAELRALPEPAARLDYTWHRLRLAGGQRVWPDRGLALFVNPENGALVHLGVFAPTSLRRYVASLMLSLRTERLPEGDARPR